MITVFIKNGEIHASIEEDRTINPITPTISSEYLTNRGANGWVFLNCIRIIRSENEIDATPTMINVGIKIKFCGRTDTSAKKNPLIPIWLTKNPTVKPITIPFKNNRIKMIGKPMTDIPRIQINPMYFK